MRNKKKAAPEIDKSGRKNEIPLIDIIVWIVFITIGFVIMGLILSRGITGLNVTLILLISALKFIAAFGLMLSILEYALKYLEKHTEFFKGVERIYKLKRFQYFLIAIPIVLLIYKGPFKLYQNLTAAGSADNVFDKILFLYGIISLELKIYLIPLFKDTFATMPPEVPSEEAKPKLKEKVRDKAESFRIKWLKFRKEIGKLHIKEQESIKEYLDDWKQKISIYALVALGLGTFIFTPIAITFIIFWVKAAVYPERKIYRFERYLLMMAHIAVLIIAILIPFVFDNTQYYLAIRNNYYIADIFGFLGLAWVSWMYIQQIRQSEFVKWMKRKQEEYEQKIAKRYLKKQGVDLKKTIGNDNDKKSKKDGENKK